VRSKASLLILIVAMALSLVWLTHPYYDPVNDASMYIETTRSLLRGEGYSYLGEPFIMRPPGFPFLLAPIETLFDGSFLALNLTVGLFGVAVVALLYSFARRRLGELPALALCVAVWLNPAFRELSCQVLSDVPGTALMMAALLLEPWARRRPGVGRDLPLALLLAAASYVRTVNLLLLPAILAARLLRRRPDSERSASWPRFAARQCTALLLATVLARLPWHLWQSLHPPSAPAELTASYSFWVAMWHADAGDPASPLLPLTQVLARAPEQLEGILALLGSRMGSSEGGGLTLALGGAALLCWLWVLVRRREAAELFGAALLAVLAVHFAFLDRLVLPILLLVGVAVAEVLLSGLKRVTPPRLAAGAVAVLILALGVLDFSPRERWEEIARQHRGYVEVADWLETAHPEPTPLAAIVGWHLMVFLERPVYSLQMVLGRDGLEGAYRLLRQRRIEAVVLAREGGRGARLRSNLNVRYGVEQRLAEWSVVRISDPGVLDLEAAPEGRKRGPRRGQ